MKKLICTLLVILTIIMLVGCNMQNNNSSTPKHTHNIDIIYHCEGYFKSIVTYCQDCCLVTDIDVIETGIGNDAAELKANVSKGKVYLKAGELGAKLTILDDNF